MSRHPQLLCTVQSFALVALAVGVLTFPAAAGAQNDAALVRELQLFREGGPAGRERRVVRRAADGVEETHETTLALGPGVSVHAVLRRAADGAPRTLAVSGRTLPWYPAPAEWRAGGAADAPPVTSPFPVGLVAHRVERWRSRGARGDADVRSCGVDTLPGSRRALVCAEVAGLTWGRVVVWHAPDGQLAAVHVPTAISKVLALAPAYRSDHSGFSALAARGVRRLAASAPPVATAERAPLVLVGGTVLDVERGRRLRDAVVTVRGGRIASVALRGAAPLPAGARVVDVRGATVLPGLWDMHAHLKQVDWGPAYLAVGVTTVRDLGNTMPFALALRREFAVPRALGPHVLLAGWVDATDRTAYPAYQVRSAAEARAVVRRYAAAGYAQVKLWEYLPAALIPVVADEAHRFGLTVTGHLPSDTPLLAALDAGMDQLNHLTGILEALHASGGLTMDALARELRQRGTVVDPTLVISDFRGNRLREPLAALEPGAAVLPPELARVTATLRGVPAQAEEGQRAFAEALRVVRALHAAGVPIVAGSDQGVPGHTLLREIELYVEAGLTPLDAIRAATLVPARVMGLAQERGTVAAGRMADLLIVDGDPLTDVRALRRARYVVRAGALYEPAALRRAAGFAP
jgi:imidazolonepropionase-like amidohydrolase